MASGDIWFLLIFIILPTAVLVSGFWALLFVRRDPRKALPGRRQSAAESKSTRDAVEETLQVPTVAAPIRAESEPVAEDEVELGPVQPLPGPAASELALDDDDQVVAEPDAIEVQPEDQASLPEVEVEDEEISPATRQIADERLVELVDVDDRDDLMAEIQRRQPAQPARLESSTDEIPDLGDALIEPARLSDAAGQHEEWRPHKTPAPEGDAEADATGVWEISENELESDIEDGDSDQVSDDATPARHLADDEPRADEAGDSDDEEDETGKGAEDPEAGSGGNPRRYGRRRPHVRLTPSDNGERQGSRGRLASRRARQPEGPSRPDEGGM